MGRLSRGKHCLLSLLTACAVASPIAIEAQAAQVTLAQATASATYPILQQGSAGETVSRLQATLKLMGFYRGPIDGNFNEATATAVSGFQSVAGLQADGVVGPATWQKLLPQPGGAVTAAAPAPSTVPAAEPVVVEEPAATANAEPPNTPSGPPILRPDIEGPAVAQLQKELQILDYYSGPIDGVYGEQTQAAVRQFQSDQQLEVDAIVGPSTWDALTRALG